MIGGVYYGQVTYGQRTSSWAYLLSLTDTATASDSLVRSTQKVVSDVALVRDTNNTLYENAYGTVMFAGTPFGGGVFTFPYFYWQLNRSLSDSVAMSDTKSGTTNHTLADSMSIADSLVKLINRALSDTATVADSLIKSPSRLLSDVISLADSLVKQTNRAWSEAVTVSDGLTRTVAHYLSDTITLFDGIYKTAGAIAGNFFGAMGYATNVIYYNKLFSWVHTQVTRPSQRMPEIVLAGLYKEVLSASLESDIVVAGAEKEKVIGGLNG